MDNKDEIVTAHMGLVHSCCKHFRNKGIEYEELFSAGCLGLAKALEKFDKDRGLQFSTYAVPVIMGEIKRLFRDGGTVKVSRSLKELAIKIGRLNNDYKTKHNKDMSVSQLAKELDVSEEKICEAVSCTRTPLSLTAEYDEDGNPQLDIPVEDSQEAVTEKLSLQQAISQLDERDRKIIFLRYYQNKTQSQTATQLEMTQVQVSRQERKILKTIREKLAT
ncbi:MAG: sigma-70 family RNA polymerase sigma factor [Ruminococcus sp.]|nr:sigma-70 family RNA polymerase sigma factor [Ruminococcus sp.]